MSGFATFCFVCFLSYFPVAYGRSTEGVIALAALAALWVVTLFQPSAEDGGKLREERESSDSQ